VFMNDNKHRANVYLFSFTNHPSKKKKEKKSNMSI